MRNTGENCNYWNDWKIHQTNKIDTCPLQACDKLHWLEPDVKWTLTTDEWGAPTCRTEREPSNYCRLLPGETVTLRQSNSHKCFSHFLPSLPPCLSHPSISLSLSIHLHIFLSIQSLYLYAGCINWLFPLPGHALLSRLCRPRAAPRAGHLVHFETARVSSPPPPPAKRVGAATDESPPQVWQRSRYVVLHTPSGYADAEV